MSGYLVAYCVALSSMFAGAAVVHNYYKPSLVLPKQGDREDSGTSK